MNNFAEAILRLEKARCPEDIFGTRALGIDASYRQWAKLVHEDKVEAKDKPAAHRAFLLLTRWLEQAETKVDLGTYGDRKPVIIAKFTTKAASYQVFGEAYETALFKVYSGESDSNQRCLIKVCKLPRDNDVMKNEADVLAKLPAEIDPKFTGYFPNLLNSFEIPQKKARHRVNVFEAMPDGAISLTDLRRKYFPSGLDVKDAAWIWNRILEATHLIHNQGIIHANITPDSFFIVPETHQGILTDFIGAVKVNSRAKIAQRQWQSFYPPEVLSKFSKKNLDYSSDIYMIGHVMNFLLGVDGGQKTIPSGVPVAIAGLIRSCWLGHGRRSSDVKDLYQDFKGVREGLGWKKEFRVLNLPVTG